MRPTLREWLTEAPYTLALSSGFFGFFAHTGFLSALEDADALPARVSGSSAGALVGGLWASGRNTHALRDRLFALRRQDFWDPAPGFGLLRGALFRDRLHEYLDAPHFGGCRVPLAVSVFDLYRRRTRALTQGPLAPAIQASCTFPGLFHPVTIDGRPHIDGGVADRPGLSGVPPGPRVLYHHLASGSHVRRHINALTGVPRRPNMLSVVLTGLPRCGPFRLQSGPAAFHQARAALAAALDRPTPTPGGSPWTLPS